MSANNDNKNNQPLMEDMHALLEKTLIETYLKGKGFSLDQLKSLPDAEAKQLMKDASIYASGKLAELEERAQFVHDLHETHPGE